MPQIHGAEKMRELNMSSLSGLLEYIGYQAQTGDQQAQALASSVLSGLVESLPVQTVTFDDALSLQALGISLVREIQAFADDPVKVRNMCLHLIPVLLASGRALEMLAGARLDDRYFFEEKAPATVQ
jgi:hypothetical protein